MRGIIPFFALLILVLARGAAQGQQGHQVLADRVQVQGAEQWQAWTVPPGVRVVREDGAVEPRFLRREFNALGDAGTFQYVRPSAPEDTLIGGIRSAGTNLQVAPALIDGDLSTYWEPAPDAPLDQWSVELDLGRTLIVQRIRLRFAQDGDPFLKFRVLISDGVEIGQEHQRRYFRVGLVNQPTEDQREFVFEVEPQRPGAAGLAGEIAQLVRIDALDRAGPRAAEVSSQAYAQLDSADQGAIDHFRLAPGGRQLAVSLETYQALPAAEQGPVRYFRHEHPRLAEVEVDALGDNIVGLTQREKKRAPGEGGFEFLLFRIFTDGLYASWFPMPLYNPFDDKSWVEIDLGARYWLDRVSLLCPANPPLAYQLRLSEGDLDPGGERIWTAFDPRRNPAGHQRLEEAFPLQEVRYLEVRRLGFSGTQEEEGNLGEIQAYGEGYVSEVSLTSPFIQLNRPRLYAAVNWEGNTPPGTRIEVRTRSGDQVLEIPHYFAITGREISHSLWERIPASQQPPVQIEEVPGPEWSNWSEGYRAQGETFKSPSPRQMVQAQVRLHSEEPLQAASIRKLELHFEPPLVDQVLGEIWPAWGVVPGQEQEFTLYLKAQFGGGNPGFDRLRLRSSSTAAIELLEVRSGTDGELRSGGGRRLWPGTWQLEEGAEEVSLVLPRAVSSGTTVYVLRFRTRVFLQSTFFSALLERQSRPGTVQQISPGDATQLAASQSLVVVSELGDHPLLDEVAVVPPLFTPNGDGINDQAEICFSIFHLEAARTIGVG
ncbi:MAG: hypothetical protein HYW07_04110, partial [Candidatus Latescibacteria bacterium]|nr:hypothetical protein [Candidatus Latescibacterota bacterium]